MAVLTEPAAVRRMCERYGYGFGFGGDRLAAAQAEGFDATLDRLLTTDASDPGAARTPPPDLDWLVRPRRRGQQQPAMAERRTWRRQMRQQQLQLGLWWLDRMVAVEQPAREKLTWFWHGHFATSARKVKIAAAMLTQNQTFRTYALGGFTDLAQAMIIDPALLLWLDGTKNTVRAPNENLAREFLELFTLGHGRYTEADVREAARALTGWKIKIASGEPVLRPRLHDHGNKQILGRQGDFDAPGLVTLLLDQPASATFVINRLWFRLVSASPPDAGAVSRLARSYGPGRDIAGLLRAMAAEPAFTDQKSALVKQPVEWAVGLMRAVGVRPSELDPLALRRLAVTLRGMGQVPFSPPSVGGWPAGGAWLNTAATRARIEAARMIAGSATLPAEAVRTAGRQRPELIRRLLGVDRFSPRTFDAIAGVADRLPTAVAVAACSPEYVVSG